MPHYPHPGIGDWTLGDSVETGRRVEGVVIQLVAPRRHDGEFLYRLADTDDDDDLTPLVRNPHVEGPASTSPLDTLDLAAARHRAIDTTEVPIIGGPGCWHFARITRQIHDGDTRAFRPAERVLASVPAGNWIPEPYETVHAFSNDLRRPMVIGRDDIVFETVDLRDVTDQAAMCGRTYRFLLHNGARLTAEVGGITNDGHLIVTNTVDAHRSLISAHLLIAVTEVERVTADA